MAYGEDRYEEDDIEVIETDDLDACEETGTESISTDEIEVIACDDTEDIEEETLLEKNNNKAEKKKPRKKEIFSWLKTLLIAAGIAIFINFVVIFNGAVPTSSMVPTIDKTSRIIGFRLAYLFSEPERGDIIIFEFPDDPSEDYVKRIIGLPGETVEIIDGEVYISDSDGNMIEDPLDEPYLNDIPTGDFGPYEVPEGCYFVLGDNRNISVDARYWENTYVSEDAILAKAIFEYWPNISLLE